jgi:hypothetical protein
LDNKWYIIDAMTKALHKRYPSLSPNNEGEKIDQTTTRQTDKYAMKVGLLKADVLYVNRDNFKLYLTVKKSYILKIHFKTKHYFPFAYLYPSTDFAPFHGTLLVFFLIFTVIKIHNFSA